MQSALFESADRNRPLADRMRPQTISAYVGQQHILGSGKPLRAAVESGQLHSMIFWGPPGTGKTTLAKLSARACKADFITLSAVLAGVKDIREAVQQARNQHDQGRNTVLFVDEVHRFNKAQQDALLPHIEDGTFLFIGATTENPSFELNNALLSRARVYVLKSLSETEIIQIIEQALADDVNGYGEQSWDFSEKLKLELARAVDGDGRRALNFLEILHDLADVADGKRQITAELLGDVLKGSFRRFDKKGEAFYDQISALHKSVRGSSPDGALYWLARMLDGGSDPLYIARRIVRMASEDIGNADPRALEISLNAWQVVERLGSPEGELALAHAVSYLASMPKSDAVYTAYKSAMRAAKQHGSLGVPLHLRNAPTKLMKSLDYGGSYRHAHDEPHGYAAGETYLPAEMAGETFYHPTDRGLESKIAQRLAFLRELDQNSSLKR